MQLAKSTGSDYQSGPDVVQNPPKKKVKQFFSVECYLNGIFRQHLIMIRHISRLATINFKTQLTFSENSLKGKQNNLK